MGARSAPLSSSPSVGGAFYWTLRMGSGWDPRPTKAHPHGRQVDGSSAWRSLAGYPFPVWSLLELAAAGVPARPRRQHALRDLEEALHVPAALDAVSDEATTPA